MLELNKNQQIIQDYCNNHSAMNSTILNELNIGIKFAVKLFPSK